jgi:DNA repair photolyase
MKRFTGHTEEWGTYMDVKDWPAIANPRKYAGQKVIIGTVTDGYNPLEETYGRTRRLLEQLKDSGADILICTKSDLMLRDMDLLTEINRKNRLTVSWSVNTLDETFKDDMDCAVSIERRLEAMRQFYEAGIQSTCFISPIFPGITDPIEIIERAKGQCNLVWLENLNLRGDYKKRILDWIHEHHPELDELYREIYTKKSRAYWTELDQKIRDYTAKEGMLYIRDDDQHRAPFGEPPVVCNYFYHEEITKSAKKGK